MEQLQGTTKVANKLKICKRRALLRMLNGNTNSNHFFKATVYVCIYLSFIQTIISIICFAAWPKLISKKILPAR